MCEPSQEKGHGQREYNSFMHNEMLKLGVPHLLEILYNL